MPPLQALTRVAEDYLKAIWSAEEWGGDATTVRRLADRFGIAPATASVTLKRLASQGLVVHERYGPISLTAEGRRHAVAVVRRHRLLETFLVEVLHYDWAEVHEEAEELEHAASARLVDRIDAALGHPVADPHGDPIPSPDGVVQRPAAVRALADAAVGTHLVARVADSDAAALARLGDAGIVPGRHIAVVARRGDAVEVEVLAGRAEVAPADAALVLLQEGAPTPP